jgi:DNA-binding NarL/FixJ family response regulator
MDIALPGMSGVEGVHIIKHQWPEIEVLMLTIHAEESVIFECLRSGATGYLLKNGNPKDLLNALREVMNGGAPMSMTIARKVAESFRKKPGREPLTHREEDVLSRLHQGHSYQAIADELFISRDTVKYHIKNIYRKLNVNNKVDAVLKQ